MSPDRGWLVGMLLVTLAATTGARAADYRVEALVEPRGRISDTQPLQLSIRVEGTDVPDVLVTDFPALRNLKLLSGPSTGTSSFFRFDGTRSQQTVTKTLTYTLVAEGPGTAEIPPIEVKVGDRIHRTEAIRLEVQRGPSGPTTTRPERTPDTVDADRLPLFLEASAGQREVWVGQPLLLEVDFYAGVPFSGLEWVDEPTFENFWVEKVDTDPAAEASRTTIEGRRYTVYPLDRRILIPTTPGKFTLTPFAARVRVQHSSGDLFEDFFSRRRSQSVIRRTEPLDIVVKRLPVEGRPEGFSGAVGDFEMKVNLDRAVARVNDAVALKVSLEGRGFLKPVPAPDLDASPDLKVFDPKVTASSEVRGGRLLSRKTWEWILVPLVPGEIREPRLRFAYFDPDKDTYRELVHEPGILRVERGEAGGDEPLIAQGEVRLQRRDVAFIKPLRGRLAGGQPRVHRRAWFVALLVLPAVVSPTLILVGRRRARYLRDRGLARARRARARARKRLRTAQRRTGQLDVGAFHEEVARALVDYVADRFDRSPAGLTYDLADELLGARGVTPELRRRVRSCLETCDFARYVPSAGKAERRAEVVQDASALVDELERALS